MRKRIFGSSGADRPLLDISSYARGGPGHRDRLSSMEIELITRTARRTPEVMVKVLTRGSQNLSAVQRHFEYLDRHGELDIETDDGQRLSGEGVERQLVEDWDLDLEECRPTADLLPRPRKSPPKLVHKLLFSMPPGTPPEKVFEAVKNFAREEFALKHRYALVLHIDEPHPHVHMVVKAVSEQGVRLNIRKATLRGWRMEFARHLSALGVEANATERAVRAENRSPKLGPIYRAEQRGASRHRRTQVQSVERELLKGDIRVDSGKGKLIGTRQAVERGWLAAADILAGEGRYDLADSVRRFVERFAPARTEQEQIAAALRQRNREDAERSFTR
jgi:hypothetical protein